jgi:hypothetical protein
MAQPAKNFGRVDVQLGNFINPSDPDVRRANNIWDNQLLQQPIQTRRALFMRGDVEGQPQTILKPNFEKYTERAGAGTAFTDVASLMSQQQTAQLVPEQVKQMFRVVRQQPNTLFLGLPKNRQDLVDMGANPDEYLPGRMTFANAMRAGRQYGIVKYKSPYTQGLYTVGSNGFFLLAQDNSLSSAERGKLYNLAIRYFANVPGGVPGNFDYGTVVPERASTLNAFQGDDVPAASKIPYSSTEALSLLENAIRNNDKVSATSMRGLSFLVKNNVQRQAGWKGYTTLAKQDPQRVTGQGGNDLRRAGDMAAAMRAIGENRGENIGGSRFNKERGIYSLGPKLTMYQTTGENQVGDPLLKARGGYTKGQYGTLRQQGEVCPGGAGLVGYLAASKRHQPARASNRVQYNVANREYRARCADTNPQEYPREIGFLKDKTSPYTKRFSTTGLIQNTDQNLTQLAALGDLQGGPKFDAMTNPTPQNIATASRATREQRRRVSRGPEALARLQNILGGQQADVEMEGEGMPPLEELQEEEEQEPAINANAVKQAFQRQVQRPATPYRGNAEQKRRAREQEVQAFNRYINQRRYRDAYNLAADRLGEERAEEVFQAQ